MNNWTLLNSSDDFNLYKAETDVAIKECHIQLGVPQKYPCNVKSMMAGIENGVLIIGHSFVYPQKEWACESCGKIHYVWPEVE